MGISKANSPDDTDSDDDALLQKFAEHYDVEFSGWDFSPLAGRLVEENVSWNYRDIVQSHIGLDSSIVSLLDMGTGGGEFLASLDQLPKNTAATETYPPNVIIAKGRLQPLGVQVEEVQDDQSLPFPDEHFDLVINRHESYSPAEVWRILKPGRLFITQQVGGLNELDLNRSLGSHEGFDLEFWTLQYARDQLLAQGFEVVRAEEEFPHNIFKDIGALLHYLKAVPWQVPDFEVKKYFGPLKRIYKTIGQEGDYRVKGHRFLLIAQKPAN